MVPEIDKGPLLAQVAIDILAVDNSATLEDKLSILSLGLLYELLPKIALGQAQEIEQRNEESTLTKKFAKNDGEINWDQDAKEIDAKIRAFYPWPGSYTYLEGKRLIIHLAHLDKNKLVLDVVQPEGKNPMLWPDFLRGFHGTKPEWFSKIS